MQNMSTLTQCKITHNLVYDTFNILKYTDVV